MNEAQRRLTDILEAIEEIQLYSVTSMEAFEQDEMLQSWVLLRMQIIGEAVRVIRDEFPGMLRAWPEVPWREIIGMRNRLVHDYGNVRFDIVWRAVQKDLPILHHAVSALLESES